MVDINSLLLPLLYFPSDSPLSPLSKHSPFSLTPYTILYCLLIPSLSLFLFLTFSFTFPQCPLHYHFLPIILCFHLSSLFTLPLLPFTHHLHFSPLLPATHVLLSSLYISISPSLHLAHTLLFYATFSHYNSYHCVSLILVSPISLFLCHSLTDRRRGEPCPSWSGSVLSCV